MPLVSLRSISSQQNCVLLIRPSTDVGLNKNTSTFDNFYIHVFFFHLNLRIHLSYYNKLSTQIVLYINIWILFFITVICMNM